MSTLTYRILPYISIADKDLAFFLTELHALELEELKDLVESFQLVLSNQEEILNFEFAHISSLKIEFDTVSLFYHNDLVKAFPINDFSEMIIKYFEYLNCLDSQNNEGLITLKL